MTNRTGQRLGNYLLTRLLGSGGFAEVYLGEQIFLQTPAAIKVLNMQLTKDDLESFLNEARTIANLVHPHIVRVLEFGVEGRDIDLELGKFDIAGSIPFLVMEYAPYGTLRQRHLRGSRLPLETIISYVKQVAEALQYAHDRRVIHRDIKPENILVGRNNELLLGDFSIAMVTQSLEYQDTQEAIGTLAYMAPEQIQGKPCPASDQYALGVVVYEWLSGEPPFHGWLSELATQHLFALPPPLHQKVPMISPAVEEVVLTALVKDPNQRFASVQAFAQALALAPSQASRSAPSASSSSTVAPPSFSPSSPLPMERPASDTTIISPRRGFSFRRIALLLGLTVLVIAASTGLFSFTKSKQIADSRAPAVAEATIRVHAQATATALASQNPYPPYRGSLVLDDPLRDTGKGNWPSGTRDCDFTGGAYHVRSEGVTLICGDDGTDFRNLAYQVQMTIISGSGGIAFRFINEGYFFSIDQKGSYTLTGVSIPGLKTIASGTSSAIRTGANQSNLIAVVADGNNVVLYVNKQQITSLSDSTASHGEIAVITTGEAVFSNVKVWEL